MTVAQEKLCHSEPSTMVETFKSMNMNRRSNEILLWSFCAERNDGYANAAGQEERDEVVRSVLFDMEEKGIYPCKLGTKGEVVRMGEDEAMEVVKRCLDAPKEAKDTFATSFPCLSVEQALKAATFCTNYDVDTCVFIMLCSMNRREYVFAPDQNRRDAMKKKLLQVAHDADLRISAKLEDGTLVLLDDGAIMANMAEYMLTLPENDIRVCSQLLGPVQYDQIQELFLASKLH